MKWRQSPSFPDYEVSEYGDVRRCRKGIRGGIVGKIMKPYVREDGYRMYILRRDNKSFHRKAHQLVIEAFVGPKPFPEAEVCHKDGTRTNDYYANLRWDTSAGNKADMTDHGTRMAGEKHPGSRLTNEQVIEIRRLRASGTMPRDIAPMFGIQPNHVCRIVRGGRWAHI